ncbi:MAG: hypothetical protein DHS20C01_17120 [marine bacterium B5-7]|nr:MAG: hypothetical protein DHS20C01_17120 [marine bacterium B5-7]
MVVKNIVGAVNAILPERLSEDVKKNVRAAVRSTIEKMDLVSREELEVQRQVLQRTRHKLEAMESRVAELEQRLAKSVDRPS